jgi:cysteine-rich repeat protein
VGGAESTPELLAFLASPVDPSVPEEDRSLLLAPQALGHLARRGHEEALTALLAMTAPDADGGPLGTAAARGRDPRALRRDLLRMALRGLALSRAPAALAHLRALAEGRARPPHDFDDAAASALQLMTELDGQPSASTAPGSNPRVADTQPNTHDSGLTYANHPDVSSPMDDTRLDAVLALASLRTGRADFGADVSCCVLVTRSGSALTFGTAGDGLDIIDNEPELEAVLNDSTARTKIVRTINYCSGPGMNIIGCAGTPGDSMAVVRRTSLGSEAVLWMHEYGHNTGLGHNSTSRYIMFGTDNGSNDGMSQSECDAFHAPDPAAGIIPTNVGACADTDLDEVHDLIDNCPTVANFDQADADADGVGDLCESICGDNVMEGPEECDDGNLEPDDGCTDSCTICGNAVVTPPEECDDGNLLNGDGCSASCLLACAVAPAGGCIVPAVPQKATLLLKKKTLSSGDQITWKWLKGPVTPKADFGAPTTTTGYLLCVYDGAGLVLDANAPAGGMCAGKACWSERSTSFKYSDKELTPDGLQQILLKQGLLVGKASITVKGKGGLLLMPNPGGLVSPITVQLRRSGASTCWEAVFSAPFTKQDATQLKDRAD